MNVKSYEYNGYLIEVNEHPIYHDFQFVVKTLDEKEIKSTNKCLYQNLLDAEFAAQLTIDNNFEQ
jgi:hypothetical protein